MTTATGERRVWCGLHEAVALAAASHLPLHCALCEAPNILDPRDEPLEGSADELFYSQSSPRALVPSAAKTGAHDAEARYDQPRTTVLSQPQRFHGSSRAQCTVGALLNRTPLPILLVVRLKCTNAVG